MSDTGPTNSRAVSVLGIVGLALALVASAVLGLDQLGLLGERLPGCGEASDCARLTTGPWGSVPGLGWPTSLVGTAWFLALAVGRATVARRSEPAAWSLLLLPGAAVSILLLGVMVEGGSFCPWCAAAHAGNLVFVGASRVRRRAVGGEPPPTAAWWATGGVFVLALAGLLAVDAQRAQSRAERGEERLRANTEAIVAGEGSVAFAGRYLRGDPDARIRAVMFTDFQCPICAALEQELTGIMETRGDVSLSLKNYPLSTKCQAHLTHDIHPNACWAARAAEAAGILGGNDGYWEFADWLYANGGVFTDATLPADLARMGFDVDEFLALMTGPRTEALLAADIAEAQRLGLARVPMVFLNGVELKEYEAPRALTRAVQALAAALDAGADASDAVPPLALEKAVADWSEQIDRGLPADTTRWPSGPADAPVDIVVWADVRHEPMRELMGVLAPILASPDVRFTLRHFPLDEDCNAWFHKPARSVGGCLGARALEAAGRLGGSEGFARMFRRITTAEHLDEETLRRFAAEIGFPPDALVAELQAPEVAAAISEDARALDKMKLTSIPAIFVNGRQVARWKLPDGRAVLPEIVEQARKTP